MPQKINFKQIGIWVVLMSLFIGGPSSLLVYADELDEETLINEENIVEEEDEQLEIKLSSDEKFLLSIKRELDYAKEEYLQVDKNLVEIEQKIEEVKTEKTSLQQQLSLIIHQMKYTELMIINVQQQISKKEGDLARLSDEIRIKSIEMQDLQRIMVDYLQAMYVQRNQYADIGEQKNFDRAVKLLFSEDSVGETLQKDFYYAFMEDKGNDLLKQFVGMKGVLQVKKKDMEEAKLKLEKLRYKLKQDKKGYRTQQLAQEQLIKDTDGKEEIYQQLVQQSQRQQDEIIQEITDLQNNVRKVRSNMEKFGDYFNEKDYMVMVNRAVEDIGLEDDDGLNFRWPIQPSRGVSAYFRDPSYVKVFGVGHNAIDLPALQGSPIRAPEDAVVYKARDNGMGYSYIVLAHRGGYMTLFGHVSKIGVRAGEKVHKGQIIGLTGGAPGTKGAGYMTTGAHLHFEMFKGGKHFDPLEKLPLSFLPLKYVPKRYLDRLKRSK